MIMTVSPDDPMSEEMIKAAREIGQAHAGCTATDQWQATSAYAVKGGYLINYRCGACGATRHSTEVVG
jgi:hypothetical protein